MMDDFNFSPTSGIGPDGMVQFAKTNAYVQFYSRPTHDPQKSLAEGRPVYDAKDFVKVMHPGERDCVDREVQESDKYRWPQQWAGYQNKKQQAPEGTPIDTLFPQNLETAAMLRHLNFHTVEQLANATDSALQSIGMGSRQFQDRAKKFLEVAERGKGFHKMQEELSTRDAKITQLEDVNTKLAAKLDRLEALLDAPEVERRGPGRPRKQIEAIGQ